MVGMKGFPVLASPSRPANSGFVSSKDLIPGRCYYTGSCWRSTFCYLGRTKTGDYRWYFIGNEDVFMNSSVAELFARSEVTKSNKKVKPLEMALSDPDACVYEDTERLIKSGYHLNPEEVLAFASRLN